MMVLAGIAVDCMAQRRKIDASWCSLGTSITWYNDNVAKGRFTEGYQTRVMKKLKFKSFENCGINGGVIAGQIGKVGKADVYTIEHGINDWGHGVKPGTLEDYTGNANNGTFAASYRKLIDRIRSINPKAKIVLCTPRRGYGFGTYLPANSNAKHNGIYLKEYVEVVRAIAKHESFPVADFYEKCGSDKELAKLSIDVALHPNDKGYQKMANELLKVMRPLFVK